jgi:hypothetical protein
MRNGIYGLILLVISGTVLVSCGDKGKEDARRVDSLFLGISLGMDKKQFYDHCWTMNKQRLVTHGPSNMNVEYRFANQFVRDTVIMRFYPTFTNEKIDEMPVLYTYNGWAPWNRQFWADSLLSEMLVMYKQTYGDDFKLLNHKTMGKVYYQMKGRRRINLFVRDDQYVQAVFTDLKVAKEKKDKENEEQKAAE